MSDQHFHHASISELHAHLGFDKPAHPLITVLDVSQIVIPPEGVGTRLSSDLYCIAQKDSNCGLDYGRNHYDFDEGTLLFTAPQQVITMTREQQVGDVEGWLLYFHPDLIRSTPLGSRIDQYSFWGYEVHEALHLSVQEQAIVDNCIGMIQAEIGERIDSHSQQVLSSNIELLLNYSQRYYARQFSTRAAHNSDVVSRVEALLNTWYQTGQLTETGQPSIAYLADQCHVSPSYLSDLLKKATGRTAKDHINDFLIDKAKNMLLGSGDSVSGIAYTLGFNYPHYFGRLFKQKTGMTPQQYRDN